MGTQPTGVLKCVFGSNFFPSLIFISLCWVSDYDNKYDVMKTQNQSALKLLIQYHEPPHNYVCGRKVFDQSSK